MFEAYFEFAGDNPWLGFWLGFWAIVFGFFFAAIVVQLPFRFYNRLMRHLNIKAKGWPPAHLDADGDWKKSTEVHS